MIVSAHNHGAHDPGTYQTVACHDRQVQAAAMAALGSSKYTAVRSLTCRVAGGVIEIAGRVPSFYLKQIAQTVLLQVSPNGQVNNLVEVSEEFVLVATHRER